MLHACPACGSDEYRRSRRRGPWERLLGRVGILPYVCKVCRKRFFAAKEGVALRIMTLVVVLVLAAALVWWLGGGIRLFSSAEDEDKLRREASGPGFRAELNALAQSLRELRREKAQLMDQLVRLQTQLRERLPATQPAGPAPPAAARSLMGRVNFPAGGSDVDPPTRQNLAGIAARLAQTPGSRVLVQGTADPASQGERAAEGEYAGMALARVLSVFRALRELGVEQGRMSLAVPCRRRPRWEFGWSPFLRLTTLQSPHKKRRRYQTGGAGFCWLGS